MESKPETFEIESFVLVTLSPVESLLPNAGSEWKVQSRADSISWLERYIPSWLAIGYHAARVLPASKIWEVTCEKGPRLCDIETRCLLLP